MNKRLLYPLNFIAFMVIGSSVCMAQNADSVENNDEKIKKLVEEVYRRYPDTKQMDFENKFDKEMIMSVVRSVLAEKVYEEYKSEFMEKFKERSSQTGRPIMGYYGTDEREGCYKRGKKKVCANKTGVKEVNFDEEIANLPDSSILSSYHLYEQDLDEKKCWPDGDASKGNLCDIPDNLEPVSFHIYEVSGFGDSDNSIERLVQFEDSNFDKNTHSDTEVLLSGNTSASTSETYVDFTLRITNFKKKLSDKLNENRQFTEYDRMGFTAGVVPETKYDEAVTNASTYITTYGIDFIQDMKKSSKQKVEK